MISLVLRFATKTCFLPWRYPRKVFCSRTNQNWPSWTLEKSQLQTLMICASFNNLLITGSSTTRQTAALLCLSHLKIRIIEMLRVMIKSQTLMAGYQFSHWLLVSQWIKSNSLQESIKNLWHLLTVKLQDGRDKKISGASGSSQQGRWKTK